MSGISPTTIPTRGMLIDGKLVGARDGALLPAENPATEEVIGEFPDASPEDVDQAVAAARHASAGWAATPWAERARLLREYASLLEENLEELARLDALDGGAWTYCDLNGAGSNSGLTFETSQLGTLTVP